MAGTPQGSKQSSLTDKARAAEAEADTLAQVRKVHRLERRIEQLKAEKKLLHDALEDSEARFEFFDSLDHDPPSGRITKAKWRKRDSAVILPLTDWHVEERVEPETVDGLNEYSPEIASKRAEKMFQNGLDMIEGTIRPRATVRRLWLPLMGDFITGYIHEELEENNYLSPTEALLLAQDLISEGIQFLLNEADVEEIIVPTVIGNHGRTTKKMRHATAHKNSYEWLMYHNLAKCFRHEPRVKFEIGASYLHYIEPCGHLIRLHHGQAIRYQGGVGGIAVSANKRKANWDRQRKAAYDIFGHFHHWNQYGGWFSLRSLMGYNSYCLGNAIPYEQPGQAIFAVNESRGIWLAEPLFCD